MAYVFTYIENDACKYLFQKYSLSIEVVKE
jgi:hypothetical protein